MVPPVLMTRTAPLISYGLAYRRTPMPLTAEFLPDRKIACARSLARTCLPVGSEPMVRVLAASFTANVPATTSAAVPTCLSAAPSMKS